MGKENLPQTNAGVRDGDGKASDPRYSIDKEAGSETCRVCQCAESDKKGDAVLDFLDIVPLSREVCEGSRDIMPENKVVIKDVESHSNIKKIAGFVQFISPDGEVFFCNADVEMGSCHHEDTLIELGCSCKNDLALVHYACALKWFVNHGSTVCEICGCLAKNIRIGDFKKVISSLKEYEALRERTASGDPNPAQVPTSTGVDPDAVAAIRRQRLSEISLWFGPYNNSSNNSAPVLQVEPEQPLNTISEDASPFENPATKWAVEGTGILLATGLLTVTLAWLIAPRVGKHLLDKQPYSLSVFLTDQSPREQPNPHTLLRPEVLVAFSLILHFAAVIIFWHIFHITFMKTAKSGLHILLGGICALTVVVFFRFFVLTRIKYGPARYWAILFVFWFLVFGIWASRAHSAHTT